MNGSLNHLFRKIKKKFFQNGEMHLSPKHTSFFTREGLEDSTLYMQVLFCIKLLIIKNEIWEKIKWN